MALWVWLFECARCHQCTLVCTRCLGNRLYCGLCSIEAHGDSVRECGRRYQGRPKGREKHKLRQQRYRAKLRERQQDGQGPTDSAPEEICADTAGPSESAAVTHRFIRPSSDIEAKLIPAPMGAPHVTTEHRAEIDDEAQRSTQATATVDSRSETSKQADHEGHAQHGQRTTGWARQDAAAVLARLRHDAGRRPVMAACCCCGRIGEVVVYDDRPRIIRGDARRLDPG